MCGAGSVMSSAGHVDGLQRGDGPALRRGDALLQLAHLVGERRLVAHRRRHPAEQRRHLRARLGEPEDVVDEQQHVLALDVAEVLGHGERRQRHPEAHAGRLVHLAEHQRRLLDDARLGHLQEQVVALPGALADAGEHRHAAVLLGLAADHLLDDDGLAHTGAAEHADLAALHVRLEQVDDLDAGLEHHGLGLELVERRGVAVDRPARRRRGSDPSWCRAARPARCRRAPARPRPTGTLIGEPRVLDRRAAHQAVGGLQRDRPDLTVADVLGHLARDRRSSARRAGRRPQRGVDLGELAGRELDVDHRADDPDDAAVRVSVASVRGGVSSFVTLLKRRTGPRPRRRSR